MAYYLNYMPSDIVYGIIMNKDVDGTDHPLVSNLAYYFAEDISCVTAGLTLFRYRSSDTYYTAGETYNGAANYWKIANMVRGYGHFLLFGLLRFFQSISFGSSLIEYNVIAHTFIIPAIMLVNAIAGFILFISYVSAMEGSLDDDNSATAANYVAFADLTKDEMLMWPAKDASIYLTWYEHYAGWLAGQWTKMPEPT